MSRIWSLLLFIPLLSCLAVPRDDQKKVTYGIEIQSKVINSLAGYKKKNDIFPQNFSEKVLRQLGLYNFYFNNENDSKIMLENSFIPRYASGSYFPYFNQQKYILHFLTRPSWEIEFYNPESSPKPNYHLVYFSDVSDRAKCSNYLSKKHKPIEDWYYTNKFWSLKKCLGIDK